MSDSRDRQAEARKTQQSFYASAWDTNVCTVKVDIHTLPNQPDITYPLNEHKEKFRFDWYARWPWLDWTDGMQRVLSHPCSIISALHIRLLFTSAQPVYTSTSFNCWHDATRRFAKQKESDSHREALSNWSLYLAKTNVHVQLVEQAAAAQKKESADVIKTFVHNPLFGATRSSYPWAWEWRKFLRVAQTALRRWRGNIVLVAADASIYKSRYSKWVFAADGARFS